MELIAFHILDIKGSVLLFSTCVFSVLHVKGLDVEAGKTSNIEVIPFCIKIPGPPFGQLFGMKILTYELRNYC